MARAEGIYYYRMLHKYINSFNFEDMELPEIIISAILGTYIPIALKWMQNIQKDIATLRTDVEVNNTKDSNVWDHVMKMEKKLDQVLDEISRIKEFIASQKTNP